MIYLVLKPSKLDGIGVFTLSSIKKGQYIPLFDKDNKAELNYDTKVLSKKEYDKLPIEYRGYCVIEQETCDAPENFHRMCIGWYLNHSDEPNTENNTWVALRNIEIGEEITIDYRTMGPGNKDW